MRHLNVTATIGMLLLSLVIPASAESAETKALSCDWLAMTVAPVLDSPKSIRTVKQMDGLLHIGVYGDQPFELVLSDNHPAGIELSLILLSDGTVHNLSIQRLEVTCTQLGLLYGLAVCRYQDGTIDGLPFRINPAWRPEELDALPPLLPEPTKPTVMDEEFSGIIDIWWSKVVSPLHEEHLKLKAQQKESRSQTELPDKD